MNAKINVKDIIFSYLDVLKEGKSKVSLSDKVVFIYIPIFFGLLILARSFEISESLQSLFVNFGSIFTALLFSVLVLIYDQESKVKKDDDQYQDKIDLLKYVYNTICFSILSSLLLVFLCMVQSVVSGLSIEFINPFPIKINFGSIVSALIITIIMNLFFNVLMIVKRMNVLLTSN